MENFTLESRTAIIEVLKDYGYSEVTTKTVDGKNVLFLRTLNKEIKYSLISFFYKEDSLINCSLTLSIKKGNAYDVRYYQNRQIELLADLIKSL